MNVASLGQAGATTETATVDTGAARYERLGLLGTGGMGEVHRVRDHVLGRVLAMKTMASDLRARPEQVARFLAEAQLTAQLEHPGIVPVHDMGRLADGRVWFTMKEVRGRSLGDVIAESHRGGRGTGWTLRRLVDAFLRVCEALAYAHARGVIHRDLKPGNVLVGEHGEVLVVDWGLAGLVDGGLRDVEPVHTGRDGVDAFATRAGTVAGTPAYMAPEQARGETARIGPRSDVYALGSILYQILTGCAPYEGASALDVVRAVVEGPPLPVAERRGVSSVPSELAAVCERAMAREPDDRFADATSVAVAVAAWMDGARREEQARRIAARAAEQVPLAADLRARARALQAEGAALLSSTRAWQPDGIKAAVWERQDAAADLERRANLVEVEEESLLRAALAEAPDLAEAHAALASRYRVLHSAAESAQRDTTRLEVLLRQHVQALPAAHAEREAHERYLSGNGTLDLATDPPGAEVLLYVHERFRRRLVPRFVRSLGRTPLRGSTLPMGTYVCVLRLEGHHEVRYPVHLSRNGHWHGVRPGSTAPEPIRLPPVGTLGVDDCYIPAGWFRAGDAELGGISPVRRVWCDAWVVRRFPVTNAEYIAFLDDLVAQGRVEEALRHAPRERAGTVGALGALIHAFDGRRFRLRPDADGDIWRADWPVFMIDWRGAEAYAAWQAARTAQAWQLLPELVWEKASRGVDGRTYPWGDAFDPSWTRMRESARRRSLPVSVRSYPVDRSVYGVRGTAGNVRDWCADLWNVSGPRVEGDIVVCEASADVRGSRAARGGGWGNTLSFIRSAQRSELVEGTRLDYIGFRLGRPA
jgi:serine/threonine-protein kinase